MNTVRAPQRNPVEAPERPELRVIDPTADAARATRRRSAGGIGATLLVVLLFASIFGVVVFQVFLVQTQSHLDDLDRRIATEEARGKHLALTTADLEAPDRILQDAKDRLGMIPPDAIGYLQTDPGDDAKAAFDPTRESVPSTTVPAATAPAGAAVGGAGSAKTTTPTTVARTTTPTTVAKATTPTTAAKATTPTTVAKATTPTTKAATTPTTTKTPTTKTATTKAAATKTATGTGTR